MGARALRTLTVVAALLVVLASGCSGGGAGPAQQSSAPASPAGNPQVITGSGDITAVVEQYRTVLGPPNSGRREINWDGVPDAQAAPAFLPGDFFAGRGAQLSTPGQGIQVSAKQTSGTPVRFGNLNPSYPGQFTTFSAERLFSPVGSNVVDLTFTVPGERTPAVVRGFGAVYTDIDTDHTAFEYFDANGNSLGKFAVPIADRGLSFLGVAFDEPIVARVQIAYGTVALGPNDGPSNDVAVMDDFIYGEPKAIKR